jgi:hypothetical protein
MSGTNKFLQFDENQENIMSWADYFSSTYRTDGVVPGLAPSATHNRMFFQWSTMAAAIGQALANKGLDADDEDFNALVANIEQGFSPPGSLVTKTGGFTLDGDSQNIAYACSGTFTAAITAAATLGDGWFSFIRNTGSGGITVDPNATETINGLPSLLVPPGMSCMIFTNGINFQALFMGPQTIFLQDQKASGTAGGTFTELAWRTRDLNTKVIDETGLVTLSANQFVLPAGSYEIYVAAPAYSCSTNRVRLQNISDSSTVVQGPNRESSDVAGTADPLLGKFTITASKTFEIQHYCNVTQSTNGFGRAVGSGASEIYTTVLLKRIG